MSIFGTAITQSVGGAEQAQRAQSRETARKTPQSGGRTRTIADTVEILIESAEAVEPGRPTEDDLKDRSPRRKGRKGEHPSPPGGGATDDQPHLDVQG